MKSGGKKSIGIADLTGDDKAKVARLVEKLVSLGHTNEQLMKEREFNDRQYHSDIESLKHDCMAMTVAKDEEIAALSGKLSMSLGLCRLYQNKLIDYNNEITLKNKTASLSSESVKNFDEEVRRLDALIVNQQETIASTQQQLAVSEGKCAEYSNSLNEINSLNQLIKEKISESEAEHKQVNILLLQEMDTSSKLRAEVGEARGLNLELEAALKQLSMHTQEQEQQRGQQVVRTDPVPSEDQLSPPYITKDPVIRKVSRLQRHELCGPGQRGAESSAPDLSDTLGEDSERGGGYSSTDGARPLGPVDAEADYRRELAEIVESQQGVAGHVRKQNRSASASAPPSARGKTGKKGSKVSPNKFLRQQNLDQPTTGSLLPQSQRGTSHASLSQSYDLASSGQDSGLWGTYSSTSVDQSPAKLTRVAQAKKAAFTAPVQRRSASATTPVRPVSKEPVSSAVKRAVTPSSRASLGSNSSQGIMGKRVASSQAMSPDTIDKLNSSVLSLSMDKGAEGDNAGGGCREPDNRDTMNNNSPPVKKKVVVKKKAAGGTGRSLSDPKISSSYVSKPLEGRSVVRPKTNVVKTARATASSPDNFVKKTAASATTKSSSASASKVDTDKLIKLSTAGASKSAGVRYDTDRLVNLLEDMNILS